VVTYSRVEWALDWFASHKSSEMDGIFPALLQERWECYPCYTWSEYFVPVCLMVTFQPYGNRLSSVRIPTTDLGTIDVTVSHRFFLKQRRGYLTVI